MDSGSTQEKAVPSALDSKRKRGRPRKSEQQAEEGSNGGDIPLKARKSRKNVEGSPAVVDAALVGQHVEGVLDGCFDAGYILTVRVGDSDTILRGVVFGPGLAVPVTDATDIAPSVKFAKRDEHTCLPKTPPSSKSQTATPAAQHRAIPPQAGTFTTPQQHRLMIQGYTPTQQPAGT